MRPLLRRYLPSREKVVAMRGLGWLKPFLDHPCLWRLDRRGVALGLAIGVFWGLLLPFAQLPAALASAVLARANVPVAVLGTLVSNPLTITPIYVAAYTAGAVLLGLPPDAVWAFASSLTGDATLAQWMDCLAQAGAALIVGLPTIATTVALLTYVVTRTSWTYTLRRARTARYPARSKRTVVEACAR